MDAAAYQFAKLQARLSYLTKHPSITVYTDNVIRARIGEEEERREKRSILSYVYVCMSLRTGTRRIIDIDKYTFIAHATSNLYRFTCKPLTPHPMPRKLYTINNPTSARNMPLTSAQLASLQNAFKLEDAPSPLAAYGDAQKTYMILYSVAQEFVPNAKHLVHILQTMPNAMHCAHSILQARKDKDRNQSHFMLTDLRTIVQNLLDEHRDAVRKSAQ